MKIKKSSRTFFSLHNHLPSRLFSFSFLECFYFADEQRLVEQFIKYASLHKYAVAAASSSPYWTIFLIEVCCFSPSPSPSSPSSSRRFLTDERKREKKKQDITTVVLSLSRRIESPPLNPTRKNTHTRQFLVCMRISIHFQMTNRREKRKRKKKRQTDPQDYQHDLF